MKRCSMSLIIRGMKIKTTKRYHLIPVRMAIINKSQTTSTSEDVEKREPFCTVGGTALWIALWRYLKKIKIDLHFEPVVPLLGIYPKKPQMLIQKNISIPMFIAALFTIAKIWKQPECPSTDEWIKQLWDINTMEFYSAIKKKKVFLCNSMDGPGEH